MSVAPSNKTKITLANVLANPEAYGIDLPREALDQLIAEYTALEQVVESGREVLRCVDYGCHPKAPNLIAQFDSAAANLEAIRAA